ncbi:MAG TPA: benzoate-CoA ligase family protein [Candidatus Binataceae bacterium]|nr:benzoate-CoA ligase family protein [Candidatus Binataceae bacterium]
MPREIMRINAAEEILRPARERGFDAQPALIAGTRTILYRELAAMVNRAGNALRALGVEREHRVLLMLNDSPELIYAYLGAIRIGAVAIAFNTRSSPAELKFAIEDSGARVLLIGGEYLEGYRAIAGHLRDRVCVAVAGGSHPDFANLDELIAAAPDELAFEPMRPDDMAFWIYTSGTTGTPKAAVHLHRDALGAGPYLEQCLGVRAGDRLFSTSKLFFAYALGNCLFGSLRLGAVSVLYPGWPDAASVADIIGTVRPEVVFSVPTLYRNLIASGRACEPGFAAVRAYASAGERLPPALAESWHRTTGVRIFEGMGTSETIYMAFSNSAAAYRPGSSGRVAPGAEVKLVDEHGEPVSEPGKIGTLWIRMASASERYWNQPEITQRAFARAWFRTGDLYSFDAEGFWYHHGRADEMLKISGQWVSPAEIEECAATIPEIAEAAAVGIPNPDGLIRLALAVVVRSDEADREQVAAKLRTTLTRHLSIYKCPRDIRFVDRLPRTATGKLQRFRLCQELSGGATAGGGRDGADQ